VVEILARRAGASEFGGWARKQEMRRERTILFS
jgi:hypothetical protein